MSGETFKTSLNFLPYFYLLVPQEHYRQVESELRRTHEIIANIEAVEKEDLNLVLE